MASSRRDHLVDTAVRLFGRDGYHATGIDKILAESGVAKMTLYKHFKSKAELILAALRRRDETFRNWFMRAVESRASTPRARLLAIYDAIEEWFGADDFSGCMFINASAEFASHDHPIHAACAEHQRLVFGYVRDLAAAAAAGNPEELAEQLVLLLQGSIIVAYVAGEVGAVRRARKAAEVLIAEALR